MSAYSAGKCHIYDAVNMIHDIIITANPFPYIAKFMFIRKLNKSDIER